MSTNNQISFWEAQNNVNNKFIVCFNQSILFIVCIDTPDVELVAIKLGFVWHNVKHVKESDR